MAELELTGDQTERIEAIRVAALEGTSGQMEEVRRILKRASHRRLHRLFVEDLRAAESVLGLGSAL